MVVDQHLAAYLMGRWGGIPAGEHLDDPAALRLDQRHDGADRLHQPEEEQAREVRVHGALPQRQLVVVGRHEARVQEGEGHAVPSGPDDQVGRGR
jgi:hypothetical protein